MSLLWGPYCTGFQNVLYLWILKSLYFLVTSLCYRTASELIAAVAKMFRHKCFCEC